MTHLVVHNYWPARDAVSNRSDVIERAKKRYARVNEDLTAVHKKVRELTANKSKTKADVTVAYNELDRVQKEFESAKQELNAAEGRSGDSIAELIDRVRTGIKESTGDSEWRVWNKNGETTSTYNSEQEAQAAAEKKRVSGGQWTVGTYQQWKKLHD